VRLPVPVPPEVIVIQAALLMATHEHVPVVDTRKLPTPPPAPTEAGAGTREIEQLLEGPAWTTVRVWSAIVIARRGPAPLLLEATEYAAVPLPDPLRPDVTVIQASLRRADQEQPLSAVTATEFISR
jgi:hypothetical protein